MNNIIHGDCLDTMNKMKCNSIDLIYADPPFNSGRNYTGSAGTFGDRWKTRQQYLDFMQERLEEMHRMLKSTGSLYLHCDPTASHYLKIILDSIFDSKNFNNEIIWKRSASSQKGSQHKPKKFGSNHDIILFYCKNRAKFKFESPKKIPTNDVLTKFPKIDKNGRRWKNDSHHIWRTRNMGDRPSLCYTWRGFKNPHSSGWRLSKKRLEEEYKKGNIVIIEKNGVRKLVRKVYIEDYEGENMGDLWDDIPNVTTGKERSGYPTQKPVLLLERIIMSSSKLGGVVLDPFCGSGTTCVVAKNLDRSYIGIDASKNACVVARDRLRNT